MGVEMSWQERVGAFFETPLGRMVRGIIKISLAGFIFVVLGSVQSALPPDPNVGGTTIPVRTIVTLIVSVFPILYLISAMDDLGVKL